MSFEDGWAAINLEKPTRIPRTEYSVEGHWDLIKAVTGISVDPHSPDQEKIQASIAFMRSWNYDFVWSTLISRDEFGELHTDMGHAEYAAGGTDRRDTVFCPFETPEEVLNFNPWESFGPKDQSQLTARFNRHYQENCQKYPFAVNMTGIYISLISGFIDLFGWEMFLLAMGTDSTKFGEMANGYASWMQQYFNALAASEAPVVMIHDDIVWASGPFYRPEWYRQYVFPNYKKYFAPLLDSGKKIMYCSDGNFDLFVDDIAATGVRGFVFEPLTSLEYMVEKYGQTHVLVGNADTRILLMGSQAQIHDEVMRCITLGKNCPGYFFAVGNHIPPNTPVENALYYNAVYEEMCQQR